MGLIATPIGRERRPDQRRVQRNSRRRTAEGPGRRCRCRQAGTPAGRGVGRAVAGSPGAEPRCHRPTCRRSSRRAAPPASTRAAGAARTGGCGRGRPNARPTRNRSSDASGWWAGARREERLRLSRAAQADSSLRPLRRRAETIARPARVRIRSRKPCVFARRRLFGWKVRLLTSRTPSNRAPANDGRRATAAARTGHAASAQTRQRYGSVGLQVKLARDRIDQRGMP
jgi:hypothetical protein